MTSPPAHVDALPHAPAVPRRLSDRAARVWEFVWTGAVVAVLVASLVVGGPVEYPVLTLIAFASVAASSALTIAVSRADPTLVLSVGPAMLLLGLTVADPATVLGVWGAGYLLGAVVRLRQLGDSAELTAYMLGAALVTLPVWLWLEQAGTPVPLAVGLSVGIYLLTRLAESTIRQTIVTVQPLRAVIRDLLSPRVIVAWIGTSVITVAALTLSEATAHTVVDGDAGAAFGGAAALLMVGIASFTAGILRELRSAARRLAGTLHTALALPWAPERTIDEHALAFAQHTLPNYTVELRDNPGRNVNEIVSPLTGGYLVARRGLIQAPFLVQDQRLLDAIAHIADTMAGARRERESLELAAATDDLTGLPNYRGFREALAEAALRAGELDGFAVVYVDVDGFKEVNDRYGHETGNTVLRSIAARLRHGLSSIDESVARVGGDEFAVVLTGTVDEATARARTVDLIAAASTPIVVGRTVIAVTLSYGIAFSGTVGGDVDAVVAAADQRMYAARGRDLRTVADDLGATASLPIVGSDRDVLDVLAAIPDAIRDGRLTLSYQPIIDRVENSIIALEALIRPGDRQLTGVAADIIVHEARRLGLLTDLSVLVLTTAVNDMRAFRAVEPDLIDVHVNVDVEQLTDPVFVEALHRHSHDSGIVVTLELSESSLNRTSDETRAAVAALREEYDVRVALDDFGQQSSTLLSLVENPIDVLKIDKVLARDLPTPRSRVVMRSMAKLARNLRVQMVVEGVENDLMYDELVQVGVRYMQGYRFGAPIAAEPMLTRLRENGLRADLERRDDSAGPSDGR